eukprot:scaffold7039_cov255-Pinguiococcus_pyrenoidosus.AAC.17
MLSPTFREASNGVALALPRALWSCSCLGEGIAERETDRERERFKERETKSERGKNMHVTDGMRHRRKSTEESQDAFWQL